MFCGQEILLKIVLAIDRIKDYDLFNLLSKIVELVLWLPLRNINEIIYTCIPLKF